MLNVFSQQEQAGIAPGNAYLDQLDENALQQFGKSKLNSCPVFVSRSKMNSKFAGESYIEELLRSSGWSVIYPEELPLRRQLEIYRNASRIVFSEGSALHCLQLLGHIDAKITVLVRRSGRKTMNEELSARALKVEYREVCQDMIAGLNAVGGVATDAGLSLFDQDRLVEWLFSLVPETKRRLNTKRFQETITADVLAWQNQVRCHPVLGSDRSLARIEEKIEDLGLRMTDRTTLSRLGQRVSRTLQGLLQN